MDLTNKTFGQYHIVRLLGRGGMGEVYEAEHTTLQRRYALKLLPEDFASRPESVARFRREAAVMANLEHAHIIRVDEFGETGGRYWLRMELVKGMAPQVVTLGDYAAQKGGRLEPGEFASILKQMLEGLAYAHSKGVVHRDLKPGNILLEQDPAGKVRVKISDFGLARVIGEDFIHSQAQISMSQSMNVAKRSLGEERTLQEEGTSTRALLGTWEYMSPEQRRGEEADTRSDVYAVGLMCYRLLTGRELGRKAISELSPGAGQMWDAFVDKGVEQEAPARYANGGEMLAAFAAVQTPPSKSRGDEAPIKKTEVEQTEKRPILPPNQPLATDNRKSKKPLLVVAVTMVVFACLGGWYFGVNLPEQKRQAELAKVEVDKTAATKAKADAEAKRKQMADEAEKKRQADEATRMEAEHLANAKGGLLVNTTPTGARVTLGGEDVQQSPATFKGIHIGKYPLRLSLEGYEPVSREVEIKENDFSDLGTLELVRQTGTVKIESMPAGAVVKQGDQELGQTPLELSAVPTGDVSYTVALRGYQATNVSGSVKSKATLPLAVSLAKATYPTMDQPWVNTLGMKFAPVAGTSALFGIWDVRVEDYRAYAHANSGVDVNWQNPDFIARGEDHPVVAVSWNDAKAFCAWLTQKERSEGKISPSQSYRLPMDAEWSVAVGLNESSGGTPMDKSMDIKDVYPWGTQWPPPSGAGNYDSSLKVDNYASTSPVGSFRANQHGLYDMGGNVWQWCEDWYDNSQKSRVLRGASWNIVSSDRLLSSYRDGCFPDGHRDTVGFRCVVVDSSSTTGTLTSDIITVPSAEDSKRGAKIEVQALPQSKQSYPTMDQPWVNTLGMKFTPVPGTAVLFGIWDVRVGDYRAYAHANSGVDGGWLNPGFAQGEDHPVVEVSWNDAKAFCAWLTQKERSVGKISPSQSYRLPTDAEWSVAVGLNEIRGGTPRDKRMVIKGVYPWGTQWPPPSGAGNYAASLKVDNYANTSPVGSFRANQHGLYDMGGNVWQWCEDWFDNSQRSRVMRGASWNLSNPDLLLSSYRIDFTSGYRYGLIGFRCVVVDSSSR